MIVLFMIKKSTQIIHAKKGQALITLLIFMVVALTVSTTATLLLVSSSRSATKLEMGLNALHIAESGAENAVLRLLRDSSYTGEPAFALNGGTVTVSVTGNNPKTIISEGRVGDFVRKVQVVVTYTSILTITSWKEIY